MDTNLDAQAVVAIKNGDRQRYRELVDRHERRVYAVAWSRLGDPDLAQEVTQETFVKGYRHLAFLHEDSRFGVWITAIARNAAISLGLRRRNEMENRRRWVLTQAEDAQSVDCRATDEGPVSVETLRETLTKLPAHHRECLVLFYLEGKSMPEAARALGLSETAFKTRLHRARRVLRDRLEERLEGSLGRLRPGHAIAPAVMAILATQKAEAAAVGGAGVLVKVAAGAGKWLPFQFTMIGMWLGGVVPGMLFNVWMHRMEQQNFRDPEGFRAQLHRRTLNRILIGTPVLVAATLLVMGVVGLLFGRQGFMGVVGLMGLVWLLAMVRPLRIVQSRYEVYNIFAIGILTVEFLASGFLGLSTTASGPFFMGAFILLVGLAHRHLPKRMDYSLFLRASQNLVPEYPDGEPARVFTPEEILAFGRFLGQRRLVVNYRRIRGAVQFRLAPVCPTVWKDGFSPFVWRDSSSLTIPFDGSIQAALADCDLASLRSLQNAPGLDRAVLEERVARAASHAFDAFLAGDSRLAERSLGEQPDEAIFNEPPERSKAARWRSGVMVGLGVLILIQGLVVHSLWNGKDRLAQGRRLEPVKLTENEVRLALAQLSLDRREAWQAFDSFLQFGGLTFPPSELFTAEAWDAVQRHTWTKVRGYLMEADPEPRHMVQMMLDFQDFQRAILGGIITLPELAGQGVTPSKVRDYLAGLSPISFARLTYPQEIPVQGQDYTVLDVEWLSYRLRVIQVFNYLDLVDAEPVIARLRAHQVVAGNSLEGRQPIPDRDLVHGLFHCLGSTPLRDTYNSLVILSLLGGLDKIDREACVAGILRFHHGRGLFGSFRKDDGLFFSGDAHDTFYAYESLRMLNALNRVKDLDRWQFRPRKESPAFAGEPGIDAGWAAIEAWVYRQGLSEFVEARKQNPQCVPLSLQSPAAGRK